MDKFVVRGLDTALVERLRQGGGDAHGQPALIRTAHGRGNPCRHCLQPIAEGDEMLVLAHRPFESAQPYAEVGPIFLHRQGCVRYDASTLPAWFDHLQPALIRGYGRDGWIRYDTGAVVPGTDLAAECERILGDPAVAYVHIRSKFNCFQCRVDRADQGAAT